MAMMECREALADLSCSIGGEGTAELRKAIKEHIGRCRRCRVVFDTTDKMLKIVLDAAPFEVPLAASARLYTRLAKALSEP